MRRKLLALANGSLHEVVGALDLASASGVGARTWRSAVTSSRSV